MTDKISLIETDLIDDKIQKILRQTSYTQEKARDYKNIIMMSY